MCIKIPYKGSGDCVKDIVVTNDNGNLKKVNWEMTQVSIMITFLAKKNLRKLQEEWKSKDAPYEVKIFINKGQLLYCTT